MQTIPTLYKHYVQGTPRKAIVQLLTVLLCHLTVAVVKGIDSKCNKVYVSTRVIKHIYDKRPAQEFDFLLENAHLVVKYPDKVYKNKDGKRGSFCFVKKIKNESWLVSVETMGGDEEITHCEVVTFFRVNSDDYLSSYELLWEWEGGNPPS
jgi:hypothetical protein